MKQKTFGVALKNEKLNFRKVKIGGKILHLI